MKNTFQIILSILCICIMVSCSQKNYECLAVGAEECIVYIEGEDAKFKGKDCGGFVKLNGSNHEELKSKVENMGFDCVEKD